jgi:hypothetical protein
MSASVTRRHPRLYSFVNEGLRASAVAPAASRTFLPRLGVSPRRCLNVSCLNASWAKRCLNVAWVVSGFAQCIGCAAQPHSATALAVTVRNDRMALPSQCANCWG